MKRFVIGLLGLALAAPALGQSNPLTFPVTVKPALPPTPALKYVLLPPAKDQTAGNALTKYYRAFSMDWWGGIQRKDYKWHEAADKALEAPLDKMPSEYDFVKDWKMLHEVDRGARMDHCDWEMLPRIKEDGYATLFPDLQSMRTLARFLALRARYQIAAGEIDQAIYTLQTGFGMARHIGEGPSLIHMLVGVAVAQVMAKQLDELIQHPACPNMYWALSGLPLPYIDIRRPLGAESLMADQLVPEYEELRKGPVSLERARAAMDGYVRRCREWGMVNHTHAPGELTYQALAIYPKAKAALIAKGRSAAQVEAMPVPQVLLLHSMDEFLRLRDDVFKWGPLPLNESEAGIKQANAALAAARTRGDALPDLLGLIPAVEKVRFATARADRRFAMLRTVEAIRLYAAQNDGKLPATLAAIKDVPIPLDPTNAKPFEYRVEGGTASLVGPAIPGSNANQAMVYKVTIKK